MEILALMLGQLQRVMCMYTRQRRLTVIQVVGTLAKVKIQNVNRVHLLDLHIVAASVHVLGNGLGHAIEHPLQIVKFTALLDLHNDNLATGVLRLDVDTVELVVHMILIRFALQ